MMASKEARAWGNYESEDRNLSGSDRGGCERRNIHASEDDVEAGGGRRRRSSITKPSPRPAPVSTTAVEELTAWGNYESTAKNARALSTRSSIHRGRRHSADMNSSHVREDDSTMSELFDADHFAKNAEDETVAMKDKKETKSTKNTRTGQVVAFPELMCQKARYFFGVYFANLDSDGDTDAPLKEKGRPSLGAYILSANATMPWFQGFLERSTPCFPSLILLLEACLRGIGQVYFQNNPISGLLILSGMFVQSSRIAIHGVIALMSGNIAALFLGFDRGLLQSGLFGYNSFLVGLALATFYSDEKHKDYYWPIAIGSIVFASFSSILFVMTGKLLVPYKSPPLTLPFNMATLTFLLATANMANIEMGPVRQPALPDYSAVNDGGSLDGREFFAGVVRGIGQVYLADNLVSGFFVLGGIAICSRISAVAAFVGSAIGAAVAVAVGGPADSVKYGLYGFNSSLSATAMVMFYTPSFGTLVLGMLAGILTVAAQLALATLFEPYGLPFMTLPFCVIALPFIIIQGTTALIIAVPLVSMTTPEDHLRRVKRLSDGFAFLKEALGLQGHGAEQGMSLSTARSVSNMSQALRAQDGKRIHGNISRILHVQSGKASRSSKKKDATEVFNQIDEENKGEITRSQFAGFLRESGLTKESGIIFSCKAFDLMDLKGSGTIDCDEFIAFAMVSQALRHIRRVIVKFFEFVDVDGDGVIGIRDLDAAREYLGLPALSDTDNEKLRAVNNGREMFVHDYIVNFVTISKLKAVVSDYQKNMENNLGLDASLRSALSRRPSASSRTVLHR